MELLLPQGKIHVDHEEGKLLLLVAGGRSPATDWLQNMAAHYPVWGYRPWY